VGENWCCFPAGLSRFKLAYLGIVPGDGGGGLERKGAHKTDGEHAAHTGVGGIGWSIVPCLR